MRNLLNLFIINNLILCSAIKAHDPSADNVTYIIATVVLQDATTYSFKERGVDRTSGKVSVKIIRTVVKIT